MRKRDLNSPVKLYYRIGEVAQAVGVQTHVLRYWESEFGSIRPQKSARGQRVYSHKDLERLLRVKELLHTEGYTIAGARRKLREGAQETAQTAQTAVPKEALAGVRQQMARLRDELQAELDGLEQDL